MNGEKGDIAIDEVTFTRNQNCSFIPDFARSTYTAGKQNITIFREKVRSVLAGFHAGHLWRCWFLMREENRRTRWKKNPWSKDKNQQQTQPTYDKGRNRTQATLVDAERSHHCAIPCSLGPKGNSS